MADFGIIEIDFTFGLITMIRY